MNMYFQIDVCRRTHNYYPFITTFLRMLSERGMLNDMVTQLTQPKKKPTPTPVSSNTSNNGKNKKRPVPDKKKSSSKSKKKRQLGVWCIS